jgi:hypothetical protein
VMSDLRAMTSSFWDSVNECWKETVRRPKDINWKVNWEPW